MSLRLIELIVPKERFEEAERYLEESDPIIDFWQGGISEEKATMKMIVRAEESQVIIDDLDEKFSKHEEFRIFVHPLEAMVPQPPEKEEKGKQEESETSSISREELYSTISDRSQLSLPFLTLISLSAIVASIGVLRNDWAIIIGAMVIAPMIGPNMGLSLSTTLADISLARKSVTTILAYVSAGFLISTTIGIFSSVDPNASFIVSRTEAGLADVGLALAAGMSGAISFTRDVPTALIGVMVSISLLPTLVVSGLLLGSGNLVNSGLAMLLFLVNLTCINLSGVLTFLAEGIKPKDWWKEEKAKKMTRWAVSIWLMLLTALVSLIVYMRWF